ncbi:MAG TPA: nucleotidyltransferase family protein [Vicinamibacteria bacterium]|nr:nucleotidyltransferase family protein [Vicinamibacteria bacterium]
MRKAQPAPMRICAVVLAAGEGRRMGGPKALLPVHGTTFLGHLCRLFAVSELDATIAVLGASAERVRAEGEIPPGVRVVVNERWREGMLTSIWRGLDEAETSGAGAVLVHPVDNPLVSPATVAAVIGAVRSGAAIAVAAHAGRRGHPVAFARATWPALRAASPATGARQVLLDDPGRVVHVETGPDCLLDFDLPADLPPQR